MLKTLNMLKTLITEDTRTKSLEQIAEKYRGTLNPSLLASAFEKTYKLVISLSSTYYGLTSEDVASFALEKLDTCLQTYEINQANFTTYFANVLKNKFREETEALNTHKRKAVFYSDSYELMVEKGFDLSIAPKENDILDTLAIYNLSNKELQYCQLILADICNSEIAKIMDVSVMTLSNLRKKLRMKLDPLTLQMA